MKTSYRFIRFEENFEIQGRMQWICLNKRGMYSLGVCEYLPQWKQYVFSPQEQTDFSADCLDDISHFLKQLNAQSVAVAAAVTR